MKNRRGSALLLTLVITLSIAGLVTSAILLSGHSSMMATSFENERDLKYAAEAALAIGKSRLNLDPAVLPSEGYTTLLEGETITGADGNPVPGVSVNLYIGPTSSNTGQFGRFASVVAEARDRRGARFIRRLELAQESFAKFAYWSDVESNMNQIIYFGSGDQIWGPVWSNDRISISAMGGAVFHSSVGTAKDVDGAENGTFMQGFEEGLREIPLPSAATLASFKTLAESGRLQFTGPVTSPDNTELLRLEFVNIDLDGDGRSDGVDEGFVRVYQASSSSAWLRADHQSINLNCGAFYNIGTMGAPLFVPLIEHAKPWFLQALTRIGYSNPAEVTGSEITRALQRAVLEKPGARCFLGGDPHLKAVSLGTAQYNAAVSLSGVAVADALGGTDESFVSAGPMGSWIRWDGPVDPRLNGRLDREYLFPLYRGQNEGAKGVIHVDGKVLVSGNLRGRVTLSSTGDIIVGDDIRYSMDPATGRCRDILGIISAENVVIADNAIQAPSTSFDAAATETAPLRIGNKRDVYINAVIMALNTSFETENYNRPPLTGSICETRVVGRGCLYLTGGLIQQARGAVGTSAESSGAGYVKRYSYDRCAMYDPPPYFPTTGRFTENRYYEIDPVNFDVARLFASLRPRE